MLTAKNIIFIALLSMLIAGCQTQQPSEKTGDIFRYQNPVTSGIDPEGLRDCHIFRDNNKWYMVGTSAPHWKGPNPGVRLYSSDDLTDWTIEGLLIDRSKLDPKVWYLDRFWAPEIHKINGQYYLLVNCRNESTEYPHSHGPLVAIADTLKGPYTVLTDKGPFHGGNDLTFFQDDDGKVYAYWNGAKRMFAAEVDLQKAKPILPAGQKEASVIFTPDEDTWDSIGIEGPYVIKHKGIYYLFYSSWSRGYEIGYATASHPLGPWTKYKNNPIYGDQSPAACRKNNLPYTGRPGSPFDQVGHNEIFIGPDGRYWISCHGIVKEKQPTLVIDPIDFNDDGSVRATGPTYTPQEIKLPQDWQELVKKGDLSLGNILH